MKEGWVRRKVKNSDAWVRRWISLDKQNVSSYLSKNGVDPALNVLHLRKIRQVKLLKGRTFVIVPYSKSGDHAGYLMQAETEREAVAWVKEFNAAREHPLSPPSKSGSWCTCCFLDASGGERRALIPA